MVLTTDGMQGLANSDAWLRFLHFGLPLTGVGAVGVQYIVNLVLLLVLARLFQRAELSHESQ